MLSQNVRRARLQPLSQKVKHARHRPLLRKRTPPSNGFLSRPRMRRSRSTCPKRSWRSGESGVLTLRRRTGRLPLRLRGRRPHLQRRRGMLRLRNRTPHCSLGRPDVRCRAPSQALLPQPVRLQDKAPYARAGESRRRRRQVRLRRRSRRLGRRRVRPNRRSSRLGRRQVRLDRRSSRLCSRTRPTNRRLPRHNQLGANNTRPHARNNRKPLWRALRHRRGRLRMAGLPNPSREATEPLAGRLLFSPRAPYDRRSYWRPRVS